MQPLVFTFLDLYLALVSNPDLECPGTLYACANSTSFYNCVDNKVDNSTVNICPAGSYCTDGCGLSCYTDVFQCPMFPITCASSVTCLTDKSYALCKNGFISGLAVSCKLGEICDESDPEGPCVLEPTPSPSFLCPEGGKLYPSEVCSYYYMCITAGSIVAPKKCPEGTNFDRDTSTCSSYAVCPTEPEPSCETGFWCFGNNYYICSGVDDVPKVDDVQPCDANTVCDKNCSIPCKPANYVGEGVCPKPFVCPGQGRYALENDCSKYIQCTLINGVLVPKEIACPGVSQFDVSIGSCTNKPIICGSTAPPAIPPTTTTTTTTVTPPVCTSAGRFLITGTACTQYIVCAIINGALQQSVPYTCPSNSLFNPTTNVCSTDAFVCPG